MNFNLQLFAEATPKKAVDGKKIIYLFRVLKNAADKDAVAMAFTTENERSKSNESETVATKDGGIAIAQIETEISTTAILAVGDPLADELEDAMDTAEKIEIWEANLEEPVGENTNKFKGRYFQGYLNEFTLATSAEDHAEYECTFGISGAGKKGDVTVSAEQQAAAEYAFADTTKGSVTGA